MIGQHTTQPALGDVVSLHSQSADIWKVSLYYCTIWLQNRSVNVEQPLSNCRLFDFKSR